jgi:uncharacterized Rossmann fold enzyme
MYSVEYVERLADMVARNLPDGFPGQLVCFTDDPSALAHLPRVKARALPAGLIGWWNKLALFAPDAFEPGSRVLYFDLDTVITGPLEDIANCQAPFAILRDAYRATGLQSSVMAWEAGNWTVDFWLTHVRERHPAILGGDQAWIEQRLDALRGFSMHPHILQKLYPWKFASYKAGAVAGIPKGCSVVFFHGHPRPHEVTDGWVPQVWKVGGGTPAEFVPIGTVPQGVVLSNVRDSIAQGYDVLEQSEPNSAAAIICGGAPSLADNVALIGSIRAAGAALFSCNNADAYLRSRGLTPDYHVMLDGRPELSEWVNPGGIKLYASMCHPSTLAKGAQLGELHTWHPVTEGIEEVVQGAFAIGGGTTVGSRAAALAYCMGFRTIILVGLDSCYRDGDHHAYAQPLNDSERVLDVACAGRAFKSAPWMCSQVEDFKTLARQLMELGCTIQTVGDGLLQHALAHERFGPPAAEERAQQLLAWIKDMENPRGAEIGVFTGDLSKRLLQGRDDLRLYLIDHWAASAPGSYADSEDFHSKLTQAEQDQYFERTLGAIAFAAERAMVVRMHSAVAAQCVADASLDFVFIDADHSYEGCKADILAWSPKVRAGGFLSGHDYDNVDYPQWGVKRAVTELLGEPELGANFTWRVRKPVTLLLEASR